MRSAMALRRANALAIQSTHPCRLQTHTQTHTYQNTKRMYSSVRAHIWVWVYGCLEIIRNGGMAGVVRQRVSYGLAAAVAAAAAAAAVDVACRPHAVDPVGFSCACPNLRNGIACSGWCHQSSGTCFFFVLPPTPPPPTTTPIWLCARVLQLFACVV